MGQLSSTWNIFFSLLNFLLMRRRRRRSIPYYLIQRGGIRL